MNLPTPNIPTPSVPSIPSVKPPKLSVKVPKVDIATGAGVPGGFTASSIKNPLNEIKKHTSDMAGIASKISKLQAYQNAAKAAGVHLADDVKGQINGTIGKLTSIKNKINTKINNIKLHVPNFSLPHITVPKLPTVPTMPALPKMPELPPLPAAPSISVPSVPNISTPTIPPI